MFFPPCFLRFPLFSGLWIVKTANNEGRLYSLHLFLGVHCHLSDGHFPNVRENGVEVFRHSEQIHFNTHEISLKWKVKGSFINDFTVLGRGRGSRILWRQYKVLNNKTCNYGGRGVKNCTKLRGVIYERPQTNKTGKIKNGFETAPRQT